VPKSPQNAFPQDDRSAASDLAKRLTRYRRRLEAEGRVRTLRILDREIGEAGEVTGGQ
jgi:hypothetical protein